MPNLQSHLLAGAITGGSMSIARRINDDRPLEPLDVLLAVAEVCIASYGCALPDKLEPAMHPRHRKFFHSCAFLVLIGIALYLMWKEERISKWVKWPATIFAAGIIVHLFQDGLTSAGLPIV